LSQSGRRQGQRSILKKWNKYIYYTIKCKSELFIDLDKDNIYPALVLFEQSNYIDWINVCNILSVYSLITPFDILCQQEVNWIDNYVPKSSTGNMWQGYQKKLYFD
jgi:hypothetical protein